MQELLLVDQEKDIDLHTAGSQIARSLEELAAICEQKGLCLNPAKLRKSLVPRLKVVLHGLQSQ